MRKLTAVIITYDEARNIKRCILSLQSVADEIVVVDSFSTDATPSICKAVWTLNMTTDYLRAARVGEKVRATGQIIQKGR